MILRAATLNVWGLPEPFAEDVLPRMRAIGERMAQLDLDLVAFQEVWTSDARNELIRAGQRAGLVHTWHTGSSFRGSGLLVLSRHPFEDVRFERYRLGGRADHVEKGELLGGKGFARLRVQTAVGPVSFVNTHLNSRDRGHRTGQIIQLASQTLFSTEPVVAMGDFNFMDDAPEYAIWSGLTRMRDAAGELDDRVPTALRSNPYRRHSSSPDRRIDFVFVRDGSQSGVRPRRMRRVFDEPLEIGSGKRTYSNHAGLLAELEIATVPSRGWIRPDRRAIELATELIAECQSEAERRQGSRRTLATAGLGTAMLAAAGLRKTATSRRRFLRGSLQAGGLLALGPAVGYSVLSELMLPGELHGFEDAQARLAQLAGAVSAPLESVPS